MFKIIVVTTMLALAASGSIAMASPSQPPAPDRYPDRDYGTRDDRARSDRDRYDRDHRYDRDRPGWRVDLGPRRYRPHWVALSAPLHLAPDGRDAIRVDDRNTFTQLRLQAFGRGATRVDRVVVRFVDGSRQVAMVGRVLDRRGEMLDILLDGNNRRIDRIVVIGDASRRGEIQVFGI